MTAPNSNAKSVLRQEIRMRLRTISDAMRADLSTQVCARLKTQDVWINAKSVLLFAPLAGEPDIWPLLAEALSAGKQVALPRFDLENQIYAACVIRNPADDLQSGQFGIREPNIYCPVLPLNRLDLILVPGVA